MKSEPDKQSIKTPMTRSRFRVYLVIAWIILVCWLATITYLSLHWNALNWWLRVITIIIGVAVPGGLGDVYMNYSKYLTRWRKMHPHVVDDRKAHR